MTQAIMTRKSGGGGGNPYTNYDEKTYPIIGNTNIGVACELKVTDFEDLASISLPVTYTTNLYKIPQYDDRFVCWLTDSLFVFCMTNDTVFNVYIYEYSNGNITYKASTSYTYTSPVDKYYHIKRVSDNQFCIVWYHNRYTYAISASINASTFVCTWGTKKTQICYNSNSDSPGTYGFYCHSLGRNVIVQACTGYDSSVSTRYSFVPFYVNESNNITVGTKIGQNMGVAYNDNLIRINEKELVGIQYYYPGYGQTAKNTITLTHLNDDGTLTTVSVYESNPKSEVSPHLLSVEIDENTIVAGFYECSVTRDENGVPTAIAIKNNEVSYPADYKTNSSLSDTVPCPSALWGVNGSVFGIWATYSSNNSNNYSQIRAYSYNSSRKAFELSYSEPISSYYKYGYGITYDADKVICIEPCSYEETRTTLKIQKRGVLGIQNQTTLYPLGVTLSKDTEANTAVVAVPKAL